ncbi:topoisomerase DNA-binding C4 zinc finger domain-containing protein, partial [Patescibacteria group bacterium]|nr:topoisomerase DNA-binding C4 zinc finger domain-containing protein [Patescibacteria group bacterium]
LQLIKVLSDQKFTQPPARFNEASLIKMLEQLGIGRPSTYAPTISTIQYRNYVEKEEGRFKPTSIGLTVNDFLFKNFPDILDYDFTAEMEDDLDNIANGEKKWIEMMGRFYKPFEKKVESVEEKAKRVKIPTEKLGRKCPDCKKGELVIRTGRFGKFVSCSDFPECKHTEKLLNKIGMKCPDCISASSKPVGDIVVKTTRKRRKFFGCSNYPKCEYASWKDPRLTEKKQENKIKTDEQVEIKSIKSTI